MPSRVVGGLALRKLALNCSAGDTTIDGIVA